MNTPDYVSKYFFFNNIKDNKKERRETIIKEKFKLTISDCICIREERKDESLKCLSSMWNVKWGFDLFIFNDKYYTFEYFNPELSILRDNTSMQKNGINLTNN